jgi:molybdopterin converting factor small subunit
VRPERKETSIMEVTVRIPTPLRSLTGGEEQVKVSGSTVRDVIDRLEQTYPGMRERLLDDKGVRRFVNLYVGDEDIRFLDGLDTKLESGAEISIVPAIAGG